MRVQTQSYPHSAGRANGGATAVEPGAQDTGLFAFGSVEVVPGVAAAR